jgi:hypothetical protein
MKRLHLRRCRFIITSLLAFLLGACQSITPSAIIDTIQPTTGKSSSTPVQQAVTVKPAPRTPSALPRPYQSPYLNVYDTPHGYITDDCQYIKAKWDPNNAAPGTVVMIIMLRGITRGPQESIDDVNVVTFHKIMKALKGQGFEAINTQQLLSFLTANEKIPPRSVVIVQDGRHQGDHYEDHFREYWVSWKWPIINGWPSQPDTLESLWQENIALENEGWVDHQAQGIMIGSYLTDSSPSAVVSRELKGSITAFEERFNKKPIAIIWPGGGFGLGPVQAARQLGYSLGFTINSRGPVMYNWVPLANKHDPGRPAYIPEGPINDPLMTLPRYWPHQVLEALDYVRITGREAAAYAEENKSIELAYYDIVCEAAYGPIPTAVP